MRWPIAQRSVHFSLGGRPSAEDIPLRNNQTFRLNHESLRDSNDQNGVDQQRTVSFRSSSILKLGNSLSLSLRLSLCLSVGLFSDSVEPRYPPLSSRRIEVSSEAGVVVVGRSFNKNRLGGQMAGGLAK